MSSVLTQVRGAIDTLFGVTRKPLTNPGLTFGVGGVAVYSGYVQDNETDPRLSGLEKYRTYSDMLVNTTIVAAGVRQFVNFLGSSKWTFTAANESELADRYAKLTEAALLGMVTPWHRVVRRASMYRFYGFSVQEWTMRRMRDGSLAFLDVEPRPQSTIERWEVDTSGTVHGCVQRSPQTQQELYLPRAKILYLCDDTLHDSPEGLGLFRHVVNCAKELTRLEQLEGFGYEIDLKGMPLLRAPLAELQEAEKSGQITSAERNVALSALQKFIRDHFKQPSRGLLLDSDVYRNKGDDEAVSSIPKWNVELLQGSDQPQAQVAAAIQRKNQEIARVLGIEGTMLGSGSVGSFALGKDKSSNFAAVVDGALREVRESVEADLVQRLFEFNGWPLELMPIVSTSKILLKDVGEVTSALESLGRAGALLTPDDPAINELREALGLSAQSTGLLSDLDASLRGALEADE